MHHDFRNAPPSQIPLGAVTGNTEPDRVVSPLLDEVLVIGTPSGERLFRFRHGELTIGRGLDCDIVINTRYTSRVHARIVREGERFFYVEDASRNGTTLTIQDQPARVLRNGERLPLVGYGVIGLGVQADLNAPGTLRFSLVRTALPRDY